ncbi:hypothetical protein KDRO_D07700 [Kluyveromyces lactis]|nr:hypothetical protein KDRO_D07700 [Kluyveromyces lactis]
MMYNFRERRARDYKELNGGVRRKQRLQNDSCPSEVSSVNTLVDDDAGAYSDSNCGEDEDPHFSSCEENIEIDAEEEEGEPDVDDDVLTVGGSTKSTSITTEPQSESEKCIFNIETQNDSSVENPQNANNCKVAKQGTAMQQSIRSSTVNEHGTVISQEMNGPPLQHTGAINISQSISIPSSNWAYPTNLKNKPHDASLQPDDFHHYNSSSDSDQSINQTSAMKRSETHANDYIRSEAAFKRKFEFGFEDFSFNPFNKPSLVTRTREDNISGEVEKRFNTWLSSSPYAIWVTKVKDKSPFAVCKYDNCQHRFTLGGNPTSSNIVRHLRRQHNRDYELFGKRLASKQRVLDSFPTVHSSKSKPIPFTKKFLQFLSLNHSKLRILNMFIEGFIPFSMIELEGMKDILSVFSTAGLPIISSRKGLVSLLSLYEKEFNEQLKHAMRYSNHFNILIDMWTSSNQKSYLAVMASFCPNLNQKSRLKREDVTNGGKPNTHVLDFIDLSCKRHTSETLKTALLSCLSEYSISHKVGSITLDNGSNNISMLDSIDEVLDLGFELNGVRKICRVRCMNHVLNRVFLDLLTAFEKDHKSLLLRIDKLASYTKSNVYIRNKMRSYIPCTIPKHNITRFLSRYRQLEVFLKVSKGAKEFFFDNRFKPEFQLIPDDCSVFCYQEEEMEYILFFVRIARIFQEFTMLLQDETTNSLCNGIEYYMNIRQYYKSCEELKSGSDDILHITNVGIKKTHLPSNDIKEQVLSAVMDSYPKFEKYMNFAFKEPGYWVAHILQPHRKTDLLNRSFDQSFKEEVIDSATTYVVNYCKRYTETSDIPLRSKPLNTNRVKKPKLLKNLSAYLDRNIAEFHYAPKDEWQIYLGEPLETEGDFISYWLENQSRFPALCSLALAFHHTKLSTADVERSFSISKRVLDNRFSLASSNLKSTMIVRNRLKCFNLRTEIPVAEHIATDSWSDDEEDIKCSNVSQQSFDDPAAVIGIYSSDSSD